MKRHGSMNRVYRLIWSCAQSAWIPVAELARGRGKSSLRKLSVAAFSLASTAALAGPEGGQVVAGMGTVSQAGATTTINQSSQNLSLNWQSFNVAPQETVNFVQ
ncbi:MAG: ESPR-type extended signal peptide-containing protein, partial [Spongiibacteraceae bacterium]